MEGLMCKRGGVGGEGGGGEEGGKKMEKEKEQEQAFRAAWEVMLVEGMDGMVASPPPSSSSSAPAPAPPAKEKGKEKEPPATGPTDPSSKQDFQAGIWATFEKLKSSESGLKVHPLPPSSPHSNYWIKLINN